MIAVVLAGGKGIRLWPESRRQRPKQLCRLIGNRSMLDHTLDRLSLAEPRHIVIITNDELYPDVRDLIAERSDSGNIEILSEPQGKNTAPAVGLALSRYLETDPDEILGIFPADHHILDTSLFNTSLQRALQAAENNHLVTIGIAPSRPETGFGYIERSKWEIGSLPEVYPVDSFREKPDSVTAAQYLDSGRHLWNAGIYLGKIQVLMDEFNHYLPEVYHNLIGGYDHYVQSYAQLPDISLDYGIAEKSNILAVVPADFGWSDLGSWNALAEIEGADGNGNICSGKDIVALQSKDCLVKQMDKTVVLFGAENLLVVESGEIILVAPRERAQDVRQIVECLEQSQRNDLL